MSTPPPLVRTRSLPRWTYGLLFVLLVAVPFLGKLMWSAGGEEEALATLAELGAELPHRPLRAAELDQPLETHDGQHTTLRALMASGEIVILHFWASWCPPCMEELPGIGQLAHSLADRRARVVSVSHDDAWPEADAALVKTIGRAQPLAGVWLREPEGQAGDPGKMLRIKLGTEKLPETYILGHGQVLARLIAGQPWANPRLLRALEHLAPAR